MITSLLWSYHIFSSYKLMPSILITQSFLTIFINFFLRKKINKKTCAYSSPSDSQQPLPLAAVLCCAVLLCPCLLCCAFLPFEEQHSTAQHSIAVLLRPPTAQQGCCAVLCCAVLCCAFTAKKKQTAGGRYFAAEKQRFWLYNVDLKKIFVLNKRNLLLLKRIYII